MGLNVGGVFYDQTSATTHNVTTLPQNWTGVMEATFYTNPSTHAPWTVAEIQSFDSTNEFQVRMEGAGIWDIGKPMDGEHVIAVDMIVGQATENRVAIGTANLSTFSTPQWINFTTTNMSGGNWSKTNAVRYLYVVRRATTYGNATVQGVQLGSGGSPVANFDGYSVGMNAEGMVVTLTAKSPDVWWGLIIRTSAPADSADSQVYTSIVEELVHSTSTPTTEFSNAAAANYGNVRLLVKYQGSPTADLTVRVRRRSDNTVMGSVITITKAQVDALPSISGSGWKYVEVQQGSLATLATATQYYWEFSSTTGSANAWKVPNWYTGGQGDALSFGGTTDRATRSGSENNSYDIQATIGTVPSTPGSWAVSLQTQTVPSDASEGTLASIQYANCTWAATSLAALFAYYEIHRTEDGGTNWSPIANLTSEAQTSFKDYEGDRGTLCGYRIRVVRTDGAFSAWSSTQSVTPAKLASDVWAFVCNENQGAFNCIYKKLGGGTYTFPEADEVGFHPVFDEDFYTVTRPTEQRGAQTEISVVMSSLRSYNQGSNTLGWALYDRLRSLARAQVDYVCVHDPWGNRMLAVITVPEGPIGGEMPWVAVIRIKQTTITYSLPTA
jgi:hypothetical protein